MHLHTTTQILTVALDNGSLRSYKCLNEKDTRPVKEKTDNIIHINIENNLRSLTLARLLLE